LIAWQDILQHSECLATRSEVSSAVEQLAEEIRSDYHDKNPVVICLMNGGLYLTAALTQHLELPLRLDYMHATRYRGGTIGKDLHWLKMPFLNLANEHVLVVDDIYDEGITLQEVEMKLLEQNPASLNSLVLVDKLHHRKPAGFSVRYVGMELEDKYLFGCGMDYCGHWRHLPQIYAVNET